MRHRNQPKEPGMIKMSMFFAAIAWIAVNTIKTLLHILVKTYDSIQTSRHARRA